MVKGHGNYGWDPKRYKCRACSGLSMIRLELYSTTPG
jgi:hypothetical protein